MDGFIVNNRFMCKELALMSIGGEAVSYIFNIGIRWRQLNARDRRTAWFVQQHIHQLPLEGPPGLELLEINRLPAIVATFFANNVVNESSAIGYKGGTVERDLLRELGIPSVDLEHFGCPRAATLLDNLVWLETCGHHLTPTAFAHCPLIEVTAYASWLEQEGQTRR